MRLVPDARSQKDSEASALPALESLSLGQSATMLCRWRQPEGEALRLPAWPGV